MAEQGDGAGFVERLARERAVAILRTSRSDGERYMEAAVRGGIGIVEITMGCARALELVRHFAARTELLTGAGTIMTVEEARAAVAAGARFLVSPIADPEVMAEARRLHVPVVPGTYTATEMVAAVRAGCEVVKLFPSPADGPAYVAALRGPLPGLRIVPTSGVTLENAAAFLRAGAFALGLGGTLFTEALEAGEPDRAEARARALLAVIRSVPEA